MVLDNSKTEQHTSQQTFQLLHLSFADTRRYKHTRWDGHRHQRHEDSSDKVVQHRILVGHIHYAEELDNNDSLVQSSTHDTMAVAAAVVVVASVAVAVAAVAVVAVAAVVQVSALPDPYLIVRYSLN